jgi:hypothetical protein
MRGMPTSPMLVGYRQALGIYVQHTLSALARLATSIGALPLADALLQQNEVLKAAMPDT